MRRTLLCLALSVVVHVGLALGIVGARLWQGRFSLPPIALSTVEVEVKDFPLGPPKKAKPASEKAPSAPSPVVKHRRKRKKPAPTSDAGPPASPADAGAPAIQDGGESGDTGRRKPGDLRRYGPEGSTLIALLRIDRLRQSPAKDGYIQALDQLLRLLPDRRRLIDGTGLDLYRDFNTLLIATPNPLDDTVTFLAARHGLTDTKLRAALDRGAQAMDRVLEWKTIGGRPVGFRKRPETKPGEAVPPDRDDRIFVLPQPSLAIMATPAHAKLLLGQELSPAPQAKPGTGAPDAGPRSKQPPKPKTNDQWKTLVERIDGEDSAMPENAVFMMVANQLFRGPGQAGPGATGAVDEGPHPVSVSFPVPTVISLVIQIDPVPLLNVTAQFPRAEDALRWERDLPSWQRRAARNPIVILSGFAGVLARVQASREDNQITLRASPTTEELQRALNLAANLTRGAQRARYGN